MRYTDYYRFTITHEYPLPEPTTYEPSQFHALSDSRPATTVVP